GGTAGGGRLVAGAGRSGAARDTARAEAAAGAVGAHDRGSAMSVAPARSARSAVGGAAELWGPRSERRSALGVLATPAVMVLACAALALYLGAQDLDEMERRALDPEFIVQRVLEHIQLVAVSTALVVMIAV